MDKVAENSTMLPLRLNRVHHIAIICSDYDVSKKFYTDVVGLRAIRETWRAERQSYKLDLALGEDYVIELFSFPSPPKRPSRPEAVGLRHLAFEVDDVSVTVEALKQHSIIAEPVRVDEMTGKRFTFIADPDGLPIEFYEK